MSILPLPAATTMNMSMAAATNSTPARPAGEMGTDNGGRRDQDRDDPFISALEAASSSQGVDDATVSEGGSPGEGPKARKGNAPSEEDTDRRAVLTGQTWHTTLTGMPATDAAGALALPAALLAHGQLALGTGTAGDIDADAPPVAVVGIGVVTEPGGGVPGGVYNTVLNPATFALSGQKPGGAPGFSGLSGPAGITGLNGLPGADATALAGAEGAPTPGTPGLTVVPAAEARPAVEAAITANADSAALAASFTGEDGAPGQTGPAVGDAVVPGATGVPAGVRVGGVDLGAAAGAVPPGGAPDGTAAVPTADAVPPVARQLSPAELAATQATAAQSAAAQVAAARATATQLTQFLQADDTAGLAAAGGAGAAGIVGAAGVAGAAGAPGAAGVLGAAAAPAGPAAPPGLPGYAPAVGGTDAGTTADTETGDESERSGTEGTAVPDAATAPTPAPAGPDPNLMTHNLGTPDVSGTTSLDLTGANAPDQASTPTPAAQVADQIVPLRTQGDGVHRIAMELTPDELGTIGVVAEIRNGQVHLHFSGANELTRETLRAALPELRQQLEDAGFAGAAFDFGDGSPAGQNDRRGFGGADQGFGNQGGRGGQGQNSGGENTRPTGPRPPGYVEPTPPTPGRHALDLQV